MTTASDGVAVIATQVARTDRRALSEAWYSALHLAHDPAPVRGPAARAVPQLAPLPGVRPVRTGREARAQPAPAPRAARAGGARSEPSNDRRRPASPTERNLRRAIATLAARPRAPVAHTVDVAGGRVRLLVQSDGRTTRIVALCSAALREPVQRAVASARYALACAGIEVGAP